MDTELAGLSSSGEDPRLKQAMMQELLTGGRGFYEQDAQRISNRAVAQLAARRIARKVITDLQRMKHTLSGDDSELKTTWDETARKSRMSSHSLGSP